MPDIDKDERIKKEIQKLRRTFAKIDRRKKKIVEKLINNAGFMAITLEDLQTVINENGPVSKYQNGENQWGTKKSPEAEMYISLIKNYSGVIRQLTDLLDKKNEESQDAKNKDDPFAEFVNGRDAS